MFVQGAFAWELEFGLSKVRTDAVEPMLSMLRQHRMYIYFENATGQSSGSRKSEPMLRGWDPHTAFSGDHKASFACFAFSGVYKVSFACFLGGIGRSHPLIDVQHANTLLSRALFGRRAARCDGRRSGAAGATRLLGLQPAGRCVGSVICFSLHPGPPRPCLKGSFESH